MLAQVAQQRGVFGKLFHQNLARTFQRRFYICHTGILVTEIVGELGLVLADSLPGSAWDRQANCLPANPTLLARNLRLGATFGL
jgi:hypothetical protein